MTGLRHALASDCVHTGSGIKIALNSDETIQPDDSVLTMIYRFEKLLRMGQFKESLPLAKNIEKILIASNWPPEIKIYTVYMVGTSYAGNGMNENAAIKLHQALDLLLKHPVDTLYGKVYYNLGVVFNRTGDYIRSESYFLKSFEYKLKSLRKNAPELAFEYCVRSIASLNLRDYEKGLELANLGLEIVRAKPDSVPKDVIALLFQTKGTVLTKMFDYHQSVQNYKKAIGYYENGLSRATPYYINILSNIITAYYFLGQFDECSNYFRKVETLPGNLNTTDLFDLYFNYSSILAEYNMKQKGVDLLTPELNRIRKTFNPESREYNYALEKYASFILEYKIDPAKAIDLYLEGYKYLRKHPWDISLKHEIALGYATAIAEKGNYSVALDSVRSILYRDAEIPAPGDYYTNPPDSLLKADKISFDILFAKYRILRILFKREKNTKALESAAQTAELMISVLEKIRISIGEEESRLLLGNKYRIAYLNVIQSLSDCYNITNDSSFLERAFRYSEKSKAASLLASMREMKALEGVIPNDLADMEREVEKRIGLYTTLSDKELSLEKPDTGKIDLWNEIILSATDTRDSLKKEFAKKYPDYYSLKYDTRVVNIADIQKLIGKKKNYISYVVSDSVLYIMVVNSKYARIETVGIDSSFSNSLLRYRQLLSSPDRNGNASSEFSRLQSTGYFLYTLLIDPVKQYLVSDELILSPDNTLAYFPFETLVTTGEIKVDLQYSKLAYLMQKFRISYAYSATLLSESSETKRSYRNTLLAFAPSYKKPVDINSLWVNRQETNGALPELKYAPEEAGYVAKLTKGELFRDTTASKRLFSIMAGSFNIIHLAMHTVINNNDPANSGMIFSDADTLRDNNLRPYEIYAIRLNAKMVVLSSCFTGAGTLFAGEGVLSIARGFIYAGSRSVVMSLWEVDDRSGTEIIKSFYRNLKAGKSKSESLRRARLDYLKKADMLHAHPYFWSTMVIYGDDSPVYISEYTRIMFLLIPLLLGFFIFNYFRRR